MSGNVDGKLIDSRFRSTGNGGEEACEIEKVIAARRQKLFELILPEANRGDYAELPDYLKAGITAHFASHYRDVAKVLFQ